MIFSKIKEALLCLRAGRVTLDYPRRPSTPPEGFRGQPEVDVSHCIGCAACAAVCPARLIRVVDTDDQHRRIIRLFERCIRCGRCAEVCPEKAITMSRRFETATDAGRTDLVNVCEVYMATCRRCGRCYTPSTPLDKIMKPGMRDDEIVRGGQTSSGEGPE
ncbi:MAG TPA: 4Fe-4S binding protein [Armatimonadota bacterium]|nr:4Fe-4S binding protein [Armatimonadota bacterium]